MQKKILMSLLAMFLTLSAVNAETDKVHVTMVGEFDTAHPSQSINVRVLENSAIGEHVLKEGDILHCNVVKVTDPKRGKRSATFAVCPTSYTSGDETIKIEESYYGKYAEKIMSKEELKKVDKVKVGKKAVLTVGNHFVKGLTTGVTLAEGMIENEEGNRIESGVKKVYKESPLSYVEKGGELNLQTGKQFYLIFKPSSSSNTDDISKETSEE